MKRLIATDYLSYLPKRVKRHILSITCEMSHDFNKRGQQLRNYYVEWDNGDTATFQNLDYMVCALKEYTNDSGYYRN